MGRFLDLTQSYGTTALQESGYSHNILLIGCAKEFTCVPIHRERYCYTPKAEWKVVTLYYDTKEDRYGHNEIVGKKQTAETIR